MVSWYNCHDFIQDLTLVTCIKPSFKKDNILMATLHENGKKEPSVRLNCVLITETHLKTQVSTAIVKTGFTSIFQMKAIPKTEENRRDISKEYILVAGASSVFVVLHREMEMSLIHCFENIHFGPILDIYFYKFQIYCVSNCESKIVQLKVSKNLKSCSRQRRKLKSVGNTLKGLVGMGMMSGKESSRSGKGGLNFEKFKLKRVQIGESLEKNPLLTHISLSLDCSLIFAAQGK